MNNSKKEQKELRGLETTLLAIHEMQKESFNATITGMFGDSLSAYTMAERCQVLQDRGVAGVMSYVRESERAKALRYVMSKVRDMERRLNMEV